MLLQAIEHCASPADAPDARLVVDNITAGYGSKTILRDVSMTAHPGQLTVLVGPNGCGKSTLLKVMARVLAPIQGRVTLDGDSVHHASTKALARDLALLPQGPVAPEGLTVQELVAQGRFPHQSLARQWSAADSRAVADAMEAAAVTTFAARRVDSLSGGQRQRCWIAMVLAQDTDIILLDEPTTFLDLKVQIDVMTLLHRITRERQGTLVVVLHELNVAAMFADQMVMMREGEIVVAGRPELILTQTNLKSVFDLRAQILLDHVTGRPVCVPIPDLVGA